MENELKMAPTTRVERYLDGIVTLLENGGGGGGGSGVPSGGATGQVLAKRSNSDGDVEWKTPGVAPGVGFVTTAPAAANADGLKFAVLSEEPGTKYSGWVYLITEASA